MARHAKVLQLLRDDKGICNASFRIIAQFYNAIRLRYMRIVFVFDFAQNFLLREFNYGIDLFLIFFCHFPIFCVNFTLSSPSSFAFTAKVCYTVMKAL